MLLAKDTVSAVVSRVSESLEPVRMCDRVRKKEMTSLSLSLSCVL